MAIYKYCYLGNRSVARVSLETEKRGHEEITLGGLSILGARRCGELGI